MRMAIDTPPTSANALYRRLILPGRAYVIHLETAAERAYGLDFLDYLAGLREEPVPLPEDPALAATAAGIRYRLREIANSVEVSAG